MRNLRPILIVMLAAIVSIAYVPQTSAKRIEAVKGKKYSLTKRHGPWMIMVATFRLPPEGMKTEGMSPTEAAEELVFTLRKRGIPAYSFIRDHSRKVVDTRDRLGRQEKRTYKLDEEVCVIAGNYPDTNDKIGRQTLTYVKKLKPKFLEDGGIYRSTPGRPGPFSGAMLTINPLLNPDEVMRNRRDPLIIKLNNGVDYSLLENKGKYSVTVASFYGKSQTKLDDGSFMKALKNFTIDRNNVSLDKAAMDAWKLTHALRNRGIEAYSFNDRFKSIVTIGSFDRPDDPGIAQVKQKLSAQWKQLPGNGGKPQLVGEVLTIPDENNNPQMFVFDPQPKLMEVPRYRR